MIGNKLSSKKVILGIIVFLLIVAAGVWLHFSLLKKSTENFSPKNAGQPAANNISVSDTETKPAQTNLPVPIKQNIVLKDIMIHTGLTYKQLHPGQYSPYDIKTANGHYLINIADDFQKLSPKLIYDGNIIAVDGKVTSIGISRNGLHYIFVVDRSSLYIDGKKITSDIQMDSPQVTDDGQHYFYLFRKSRDEFSSLYDILKKDGNEIYSYNDGILTYQISYDGKHYLAGLRNRFFSNNFRGSIISFDGNNISSDRTVIDGELVLSNNGEHYGYILLGEGLDTNSDGVTTQFGKEELYVDGKKILESKTMYSLRITDYGNYAVSALEDRVFYTDKQNLPMKSDSNGAFLIFIDNGLNHYLTLDDKWYLDDKAVKIDSDGDLVELTESSIFVYKIMQ
jgi:hypothetical protein